LISNIHTNISKKILIGIPAFNEAGSISKIISISKKYGEVVVYDDGSTDGTREIAIQGGAKVIGGRNNRGYGAAIRALFRIAKEEDVDVMVTLDADGQHDPSQIGNLIEPLVQEDVDIVIGSRFLTRHDSQRIPKYRSFGIKTITRLTQAASYKNLTDAQSGFRAYGKRALSRIEVQEFGMGVSTEILVKAKDNDLVIKEVPVTVTYEVKDASTHNPLSHGMGVIYSVMQFISLRHPLAFYSLPGIILLIIAAFYMNTAMELYSTTKYISTNMILVSVGTAVVGVVLFATGVILYTLTALLRGRIKELR
jgi:glycosyltransferase involved in cell wall biosynthesis